MGQRMSVTLRNAKICPLCASREVVFLGEALAEAVAVPAAVAVELKKLPTTSAIGQQSIAAGMDNDYL